MASQSALPVVAAHGALRLPSVDVDSYNIELKDDEEIYTLLIRERQDLAAFRRERDKALVSAVSKPEGQRDLASNNAIRKQVSDSEIRLAAIGALLEKQFPEYAALAM